MKMIDFDYDYIKFLVDSEINVIFYGDQKFYLYTHLSDKKLFALA